MARHADTGVMVKMGISGDIRAHIGSTKGSSCSLPRAWVQVTRRTQCFISTSTLTLSLTPCGPSYARKAENSPCPSIIDFGWVCPDLVNSDAHLADGQKAATTDPSQENRRAAEGSWGLIHHGEHLGMWLIICFIMDANLCWKLVPCMLAFSSS